MPNLPDDGPLPRVCGFLQSELDFSSLPTSPLISPPISYDEVDGVEFRKFDVLPEVTPELYSLLHAFVSTARNAPKRPRVNQVVDSIDNSAFWFKLPPPQELYTVIISLAVSFSKPEFWEDIKAYNLFVRQMPLGCFCIKAPGAGRTVIPDLRVCIESLAADEMFAQWREHLLWPSAALKARVRDDARRHAVKFYSDGNSVAVAQTKRS